MAKKAKRRGRPRGSKNKKKLGRPAGVNGLTKSFANMEVGQLRAYINNLEDLLTKKVTQQRQILEGQLAGLQIYTSSKAGAAVRTVMRVPRTGKRRKPVAKYQSKKDMKLKWTGRGLLPVWMREEVGPSRCTRHWPPASFRLLQNVIACSEVAKEPKQAYFIRCIIAPPPKLSRPDASRVQGRHPSCIA